MSNNTDGKPEADEKFQSLPEKPSNTRRRGMEREWLQKYICNYQLNCLL
jgi:hypothetical protein